MDPVKYSAPFDARKKAFSLFEEFKNFAFKGNVIDLAVGVIIGAAFGKIIDSLVKHLIMPLIGVIMPGKQSYLEWTWVINGKEIPYGLFLGEIVNFLIVALALYIFIVKFLGLVMKAKKEEAAAPPPPTRGPGTADGDPRPVETRWRRPITAVGADSRQPSPTVLRFYPKTSTRGDRHILLRRLRKMSQSPTVLG